MTPRGMGQAPSYPKEDDTTMEQEGTKNDKGKARFDLLPPEALEKICLAFNYGAEKYADRNWEKGLAYGRCFAALMRHLWAWWRREETDPESGLSHLAHAGACLFFLIAFVERGRIDLDDRARHEDGVVVVCRSSKIPPMDVTHMGNIKRSGVDD